MSLSASRESADKKLYKLAHFHDKNRLRLYDAFHMWSRRVSLILLFSQDALARFLFLLLELAQLSLLPEWNVVLGDYKRVLMPAYRKLLNIARHILFLLKLYFLITEVHAWQT